VKSQFDAFRRDLVAVGAKFGVDEPDTADAGAGGRGAGGRGGGGRGGGGRGGGGADPANVFGRAGQVKGAVQAIWEVPSAAMMRQVDQVRTELPRAITEANGVIGRAGAVSQALRGHNITLNVGTR
jgi:hypothetical protein